MTRREIRAAIRDSVSRAVVQHGLAVAASLQVANECVRLGVPSCVAADWLNEPLRRVKLQTRRAEKKRRRRRCLKRGRPYRRVLFEKRVDPNHVRRYHATKGWRLVHLPVKK